MADTDTKAPDHEAAREFSRLTLEERLYYARDMGLPLVSNLALSHQVLDAENERLREQLADIRNEAVHYGYAIPAKLADIIAGKPSGESRCPICRTQTLNGLSHSCPRDRSEWSLPVLELNAKGSVGKVITPDAEFVVQWSRDKHGLDVLVDEGHLLMGFIACNAVELRVVVETNDGD